MNLSQIACSIPSSPTVALNEEARLLHEKGEPVIHLGIGEPKNKTPIAAILGSAAKLNSGDVKYEPTDGTPSLKKAVILYTEENYDRVVGPQNVIISDGAKQSLWNVLFALLNPQEEVIVLAPYWVSYPEMIRMVGGIPVIVTPEDGSFVPSFEEIERAVSSNTKGIIVNSPNNPSGAVYPEELIARIVELCESKGIYMICDDIYHRLVFDGKVAIPAYRFSNKDVENSKIVAINGVAKLYGMTGFRIGWVVAQRKLVEILTNIQSQTTTCVSPVMQAAAEGALTGIQSNVEALRLSMQNNRDVLMQELRSFNGVRCFKPQGTFYAMPDFRAYCGNGLVKNSVELAKFLLKKALVVTVPGKEFGMEGYLRLSYSGTANELTEGLDRMKWALDPKAPPEIYIGDRKIVRDWI
ncbi:MAG: pyridoxal phosphate-dependent aminotransferase [Anaerolineales bacterium]|jgi:aspartate aminotransferase